jgi:hypothetical protein
VTQTMGNAGRILAVRLCLIWVFFLK